MTLAQNLRVIKALMQRALNEILRVPGATIPGVLAPTIFMIGLSGVFGKAAQLPGFAAGTVPARTHRCVTPQRAHPRRRSAHSSAR